MDSDPAFDNLLSTSSNLLEVTSLRNTVPHHPPTTPHPSQSHSYHHHNGNAADDNSPMHSQPFAHPDMFLGGGIGPSSLGSAAATTDFDVYNLPTMLPPDFDRPMAIPFADRPPIPPMGYIPGGAAGHHLMPNPAVLSLGIGPLGLASASSHDPAAAAAAAAATTTIGSTAAAAHNNIRHNDNKSNSNAAAEDDDDDDDDDEVDDDDDDVDDDGDEDIHQQHTGSSPKKNNKSGNKSGQQPRRQRKKGSNKKALQNKSKEQQDHDNFSMDMIDKDSTDALLLSTNTGTTSTATAAPSSSGTVAVRGNVSHTRRCRAKVNSYFERLMDVLPTPPAGMEVKHKAQILNYAIERFHAVQRKNMQLEMRLALSSSSNLRRWVHTVVSNSRGVLSDALKPFMALICLTKGWKYAELWAPRMLPSSSSLTHNTGDVTATNSFHNNNNNNSSSKHHEHHDHHPVLRYVTGAVPPTVQGEQLTRVKEYRAKSRKFVFRPRSGVPGRVFLTMRPEWLPLLNDPIAFPRAPHAVKNKVEITFAVPVIVGGSVKMVVQFYDLERREYDPNTLNTAHEIAELFGKAFTGLGR